MGHCERMAFCIPPIQSLQKRKKKQIAWGSYFLRGRHLHRIFVLLMLNLCFMYVAEYVTPVAEYSRRHPMAATLARHLRFLTTGLCAEKKPYLLAQSVVVSCFVATFSIVSIIFMDISGSDSAAALKMSFTDLDKFLQCVARSAMNGSASFRVSLHDGSFSTECPTIQTSICRNPRLHSQILIYNPNFQMMYFETHCEITMYSKLN